MKRQICLVRAEILEKRVWGEYVLYHLHSPKISRLAEPGQFIMVRVSDQLIPLLRRPFSLMSTSPNHGRITIFFQKVGPGTLRLSQYSPGETLSLIGPLGQGFSLAGLQPGNKVLLVGGGRGIAPLFFLAQRLKEKKMRVVVFYGGKTAQDLPLRAIFEDTLQVDELILATEDGSLGEKGLITEVMAQKGISPEIAKIYVCGPEAMMRRIAQMRKFWEVPSEFSLETFMGCGLGICWSCVRRIRKADGWSWVKVCEEGPVFPGEVIKWEE